MERAVMGLARLSLGVVLLLSMWCPSAQAARFPAWHRGAKAVRILGELPPCKDVWGGIPGWDCFDPPTHDLPPCDFHLQRAGIDCWPPSPPKPQDSTLLTAEVASTHVERALPPCKDVPGGIPPVDCYDPPLTPAPKVFASTQDLDGMNAATTQSVEGRLPPCKDVPGGIQGWDCYDPPATPLPPCDYQHQNPGIDCWPRSPPMKAQESTLVTDHVDGSRRVEGAPPPCKDVPGGIPPVHCYDPPPTLTPKVVTSAAASTQDSRLLPRCRDVFDGIQGWDCYDPPSTPLLPCDGTLIDCELHFPMPPPAPKAKQGATPDISDLL